MHVLHAASLRGSNIGPEQVRNVIDAICFYQEGRISTDQQRELEERLQGVTTSLLHEELSIAWKEIERGNGWTGVGRATGANIALHIPDVPQDIRTSLLSEVCAVWRDVTQCKIFEIVASAINREQES